MEETSSGDENEKGMTLGDALSQAKETSLTSVEELQNLAGGADIKVLIIEFHSFHTLCIVIQVVGHKFLFPSFNTCIAEPS